MLWGATPALAQSAASASAQAPQANDEVARGLFQAGKSAYQAGSYRDALSFFEQAYQRSGRAALLYNIGQAADRLRQDDKAIESFTKYLEQTPDAPNRAEVEQRVQALREARQARQDQEAKVDTAPALVPAIAPTPEQTAQQAPVASTHNNATIARSEPDKEAPASEPVTKKWWFWTAVGAVVVGGTATALALALGGEKTVQQSPYQGNANSLQAP
jgi:tetratricopeptide (TPR) repeat protein